MIMMIMFLTTKFVCLPRRYKFFVKVHRIQGEKIVQNKINSWPEYFDCKTIKFYVFLGVLVGSRIVRILFCLKYDLQPELGSGLPSIWRLLPTLPGSRVTRRTIGLRPSHGGNGGVGKNIYIYYKNITTSFSLRMNLNFCSLSKLLPCSGEL